MKEFHITDNIEQLIKISRNFEDERFRLLAERIICNKNSANIPEDIKSRYDDLINERVHSECKCGSVDKELNDIEKLLDEKNNKEDQSILLATKEQLLSMQH